MASIPKNRINPSDDGPASDRAPTTREKRSTQITRGIKTGVIKGTVDQVLDQIATPIAEMVTPRLHALHSGLQIADPAVKSLIEFAVLNALAEVMEFGGPALAKVPGIKMSAEDAQAKTRALAQYMRNYSGEKFGEQIAETAAALIPLVASMLADVDLGALLGAVDETDELVVEPATAGHQLFHGVGAGGLTENKE